MPGKFWSDDTSKNGCTFLGTSSWILRSNRLFQHIKTYWDINFHLKLLCGLHRNYCSNSDKFALGVCFESFISCSSKSFSHTFYWQSFNQERSVRRPLKSFPGKQYKPRWVKLLAKCGRELGNKENLFLPTFVFANSSFSEVWIKFQRSYQGRTILKSSSALDLIRQNQTKNQSRRISGFAEVLPRH